MGNNLFSEIINDYKSIVIFDKNLHWNATNLIISIGKFKNIIQIS